MLVIRQLLVCHRKRQYAIRRPCGDVIARLVVTRLKRDRETAPCARCPSRHIGAQPHWLVVIKQLDPDPCGGVTPAGRIDDAFRCVINIAFHPCLLYTSDAADEL